MNEMPAAKAMAEPTESGRARIGGGPWTVGNQILGVDPQRVRLWVGGQRLHHGATGICVAGAAAARLLSRRRSARPLAWIVAGGALVAHDWKDRNVWFAPGTQEPRHPRAAYVITD